MWTAGRADIPVHAVVVSRMEFSTALTQRVFISFVRFESKEEAHQYKKAWYAASGGGAIRNGHRLNKIKYEHAGHNGGNPNHKGKA